MVLINVTSLNVKMSAYDAVDGSSTGIQVLLFRNGECLLLAQSCRERAYAGTTA